MKMKKKLLAKSLISTISKKSQSDIAAETRFIVPPISRMLAESEKKRSIVKIEIEDFDTACFI